jgi:hypothetical protein
MKPSVALSLLLLFAAAPVRAQEPYDPQKAGHPVRIAAYILHPVGWLLDRLIFYPAWWIGGHEPLRSIFGHEGLPGGRDEGVHLEPSPLAASPAEGTGALEAPQADPTSPDDAAGEEPPASAP